MKLTYYTDGGCKDKFGAWACIAFVDGDKVWEKYNTCSSTTHNQMELYAGLVALSHARTCAEHKHVESVKIYSDSKYLVDGITNDWLNGWQDTNFKNRHGQEIANLSIWRKVMTCVQKIRQQGIRVDLEWVRGHSGNRNNIAADKLVSMAMREYSE